MNENPRIPADEESQQPTASSSSKYESAGAEIGPYKLLQVIGEGGMGTVFLAQQEKPIQRRVALKIIKPGMDSKQIVARFEAERQALSMMDHPNIAHVLDVGTTELGRPYFVMELVKGLPITKYCEQKKLPLEPRLKMIKQVCDAVQHAHQKGIIHRDLKPSNILVTEIKDVGVPKIIDFGLAKALHQRLTDMTMYTQMGQVIGTLEYMSPEQSNLNQLDVDTRTDVYSLGVLIYELITGTVPFDSKRLRSAALDQALKIIRDEEPLLPSSRIGSTQSSVSKEPAKWKRSVRGELDWIVMKAMDKDRARRYETANGLAMDIQRFLDGEPIVAAPPSTGYRLRKFMQRNRAVVASIALVGVALLLGFIGTSIGMAWALREKARADEENEKATQAALIAAESSQQAQQSALEAKESAERADYARYVSNIQACDSQLARHATLLAQLLLQTTPAGHRNWEWGYLVNRSWQQFPPFESISRNLDAPSQSTAETWSRHPATLIRDIIPTNLSGGLVDGHFTPDGNSIVLTMTSSTGTAASYSLATGELQSSYSIPSGMVSTVRPSPDGKRLLGFVFVAGAVIWDVDTTNIVASHSQELVLSSSWTCQWSPDQRYFASTHMGGTVRLWDSQSLVQLAELGGHTGDAWDLFFDADSSELLAASLDGAVRRWSILDGKLNATYQCPVDSNWEFQRFSPNGTMAIAVSQDGSATLWEIETQTVIRTLGESTELANRIRDTRLSADISPDLSCLALMTGEQEATLFDLATGDAIGQIITDHVSPLRAIHFSPNGKFILTVSGDGRAKIWASLPRSRNTFETAHDDVVYQMDFDERRGRLLTGSYDLTATVWDFLTKTRIAMYDQHTAEVLAVDLSPNGKDAATLDAKGVLHVWDATSGAPRFRIDPESRRFADHINGSGGGLRSNMLNFPAVMSTGIYSPDGARLVSYHQDAMKVFDAQDGSVLAVLEGATDAAWPVFSSDSSLVSLVEMNARTAGVWDLASGRLVSRVKHRQSLVMIDFSPVDERLLTGAFESKVTVWNPRTGEALHVLDRNFGTVSSCHFSDDGKYVLVGFNDCTSCVWNAVTGELITTLVGHTDRVRDVRFSRDQTRLISWAIDDNAIVWDLAQPRANQLVVLGGTGELIQARWTPDGRDIITCWSDGRIDLFQGATREHLQSFPADERGFEASLKSWRNR